MRIIMGAERQCAHKRRFSSRMRDASGFDTYYRQVGMIDDADFSHYFSDEAAHDAT